MADMHNTSVDLVQDVPIPPIELGESIESIKEKLFFLGQATSYNLSNNVKIISEIIATQNAADGQYQETVQTIDGLSQVIGDNIDQLQVEINTLSSDIDSITGEINTLNSSVDTLSSDVTGLGTSVGALNTTVSSIQTTVNSNSSNISTLNTSYSTLNSTVSALNTTVNANISSINAINITTSGLESDLNDLETLVNSKANITTTNAINATVTAQGIKLDAINSIELDVNGFVTGYVQVNDGTTGSFNILASEFNILHPVSKAIMLQYNTGAASLDVVGTMRLLGDVIGYANFNDKPNNLSAINSSEGSKLSGIEANAQANATNAIWTRNYVVSTSNKLALKMRDGSTNLATRPTGTTNNTSKYLVKIITTGTGTVTDYSAIVEFNGTSFDITVLSTLGTSSNHPRLESSGTQVLVSTYHASNYTLAVTITDMRLVTDADNTVNQLNTVLDVTGTIRGINIEASDFKTIAPDVYVSGLYTGAEIYLEESSDVIGTGIETIYYGVGLRAVPSVESPSVWSLNEAAEFKYSTYTLFNSMDGGSAVVSAAWESNKSITINYEEEDLPFDPGFTGTAYKTPPALQVNGIVHSSQSVLEVNASGDSASIYAIKAVANNTGAYHAYGIYARAEGSGGGNKWAGYFVGNVNVSGNISTSNSGDVSGRLFRSTYANQSSISGGMVFRVNNSSDNYLRTCSSKSAIRAWLNVGSATEVGDYCFAQQPANYVAGTGVLISGSQLRAGNTTSNVGGSLPGTWRIMGYAGSTYTDRTRTLYARVS